MLALQVGADGVTLHQALKALKQFEGGADGGAVVKALGGGMAPWRSNPSARRGTTTQGRPCPACHRPGPQPTWMMMEARRRSTSRTARLNCA